MEALQKEDDSPFKLGYIRPAAHCLALESPLFRAAAAAHTPPASDFLLVSPQDGQCWESCVQGWEACVRVVSCLSGPRGIWAAAAAQRPPASDFLLVGAGLPSRDLASGQQFESGLAPPVMAGCKQEVVSPQTGKDWESCIWL